MIKNAISETIGWYGAVALLLAYALSTFKLLSQQTVVYQVLNLTGAVGIVYVCLAKGTYQPAVLNTIWAIVALIALVKLLSPRVK